MASRRAPVDEPVDNTPQTPASASYDMGFAADELALPRLRVVGKDARLVELDIARPGDIAIGADAEDPDSTVYPNPGDVLFVILDKRVNYACGYGGTPGSWEEGDPSMPDDAKKQYHYTLCVPEFDTILPVVYTAGGGAAGKFRRINTILAKHTGVAQRPPYELGFKLSTYMESGTIQGNKKSWPAPVIAKAELSPEQLAVAKEMYESVVGPGRKQLAAGNTDGPDY